MARARGTGRHTGPVAPARSLADDLRQRTDAQLATLLVRRPDLARPAPADLTALAARAGTRPSAHRAVEHLDAAGLATLEALAVAADDEGADTEAVAGLLGADPARIEPLLHGLWDLALAWRGAGEWQVVRAGADALGPHPGGLGLSAAEVPERYAAHRPPTPAVLPGVLAGAPAAAQAILDTLLWGPPTGAVPPSGPAHDAATWLVEQGLVAPSGLGHVTLVREVALALRGGRVRREARLEAPSPTPFTVDRLAVDRSGGAAGRELVDQVGQLGELWSADPPRVLRSGGLAARDLARLAAALDLPAERAGFVAETALAAGLVGDDGELTPAWAPTPDLDRWVLLEATDRWAALAVAWLAGPRAVGVLQERTAARADEPARERRAVAPLAPEAVWPPVRALRADVLGELARLPPGEGLGEAELLGALLWSRPLRDPATAAAGARVVLREADWIGVTGRGALTSAGRALLAGEEPEAVAAAAALPDAVDHVLVQADLTVVAPGPLDGELGRFIRLVSDVESRGGATVLRLTPESVRRAFDVGWTADDVLASLVRFSRTPVPQPVDYLVRDVARRHGQVRVGAATAYLRCDDEATLAAMLADRGLASAMLRRLAPSVLVSQAEPRVLVELLRDRGYAPAHEAVDGSLLVAPRSPRRARPRRSSAAGPPPMPAGVDLDHAHAVVAALRAAPPRPAAGHGPAGTLATDPATTSALLRQAASDELAVWLGYADGNGRTDRHFVRPLRIEAGRLYAVSGETDGEQVFLLHRITGVTSG